MDLSNLGGSTKGNENDATEKLKSLGVSNPSSGLVRFLAYNDQGYAFSEASQYNLPISQSKQFEEQSRLRAEAIKPALASYEASKPEVTQAFDTRASQLEAEKQPMIARYDKLLSDITGRITKDTTTNFAQRGFDTQSGFIQEAITNKVNPAQQDIGFARESDLRDLNNQITGLTTQKVGALRDIDNRIAEMQANGANQAVTDALGLHREDLQRKFDSRLDALQIKLAESQNAPKYESVSFDKGLYSFNPQTGQYANSGISQLREQVGGGVPITSNPIPPKPQSRALIQAGIDLGVYPRSFLPY